MLTNPTQARPAEAAVRRRVGHPGPWLALGAGAMLFPLTQVQTVLPVAAWLAPILLLRFARQVRWRLSLPVLALVFYAGNLVASRDTFSLSEVALVALASPLMLLPYWLDGAIGKRLSRGWRTLVFPLTDTALVFLISSGTWATMGHPAYTQVAELPLLQLTAVTGIWGLGFLLMWAAPVVNDVWEHGWNLRSSHPVVRGYAAGLLAVLLFGGAWLAFVPEPDATVRVAALAPDRELREAVSTGDIPPGPLSAGQRRFWIDGPIRPLLDDLLARSRSAAEDGAELVVWAEAAAIWFKEDEAELLAAARDIAQTEGIYLQIAAVFVLPAGGANENRAVLFGPEGELLWDYHKALVVPGDGNLPGPGVVPVVDTPFGRLATVICFDADLPRLVHQAGRAGADIVLVPSSDWRGIAELHARMAVPRAVENGVALVRPTARGTSLVVDSRGQVLGTDEGYFVDDHHTLTVDVPTTGTWTPYRLLGDAFGYLAVAGLLLLLAAAAIRMLRMRTRRT